MSRARRDQSERFTRTVDEEVRLGVVWSDYRTKLAPFLLPRPDASPEDAAAAIRAARAHELTMDATSPGTPGTPPAWPHWQGTHAGAAAGAIP